MYWLLKSIHLLSLSLSISLFAIRGVWMVARPERLARRWVRIVPHVIDTVLLLSAIGLMLLLRQYPFVHDWLTAKLVALIAYIVLGSIALKYGPTRRIRVIAFAAALMVFAYIVGVALNHHPLAWFAGLQLQP